MDETAAADVEDCVCGKVLEAIDWGRVVSSRSIWVGGAAKGVGLGSGGWVGSAGVEVEMVGIRSEPMSKSN